MSGFFLFFLCPYVVIVEGKGIHRAPSEALARLAIGYRNLLPSSFSQSVSSFFFYWNIFVKICFCFTWKIRVYRDRGIFDCLVYFPNGYNDQSRVCPKLRARSFFQVPCMGVGPKDVDPPLLLSQTTGLELGQKVEQLRHNLVPPTPEQLFIWKTEWQTQREWQRSSLHWLAPQMVLTTWPGGNHGVGIPCWSPTRRQGPKYLGQHSLLSQSH